MATNATIFKVDLQIADLDRHYYQSHTLTIARHPSETDERMMVRVLAFACLAHKDLSFGKGLSTDDEPDLWRKSMTDVIEQWIEVGQPDEKRLRRAAGRSRQVYVFSYGGEAAEAWWQHHQRKLKQMDKLVVYRVPEEASQALTGLVERTMQLQCTIQDGEFMFTNGERTVEIVLEKLKP